jgi:hypothetical protein
MPVKGGNTSSCKRGLIGFCSHNVWRNGGVM